MQREGCGPAFPKGSSWPSWPLFDPGGAAQKRGVRGGGGVGSKLV